MLTDRPLMPTATLAHDSPKYREAIHHIKAGEGTNLVFAYPTEEERQKALSVITEHLDYNVHQVNARSIISDRYIETQGNLREMFDSAQGEANVLIFENGDALFDIRKESEENEENEALIEYLFRRMDAFRGVVIVCLHDTDHIKAARQHETVDMVVEF